MTTQSACTKDYIVKSTKENLSKFFWRKELRASNAFDKGDTAGAMFGQVLKHGKLSGKIN